MASNAPLKKQGPRPLQLGTSVASPSSAPSPLSRSNSANSKVSRRPHPKRLSSISYSNSSIPFSPISPALRSAPLGRSETNSVERLPDAAVQAEEVKPPPVVTLAEKHKDLLQFIAQKESKCLELRSQLEQHEAELRVLKSKWERIVSKAKPRSATTSSVMTGSMSGEVVGVIREVGKYLGGLANEETKPTVPQKTDLMPATSVSSCSEATLSPGSPKSVVQEIMSSSAGTGTSHLRRRELESHRLSMSSTSSGRTKGDASIRDSVSSTSTALSSPDLASLKYPVDDITSVVIDREGDGIDSSAVTTRELSAIDLTSWVPAGLNKKWEQVQKTDIFTKHTQRASLLLSDVGGISNNLLGSLSSAILPPAPAKPSLTKRSNTISSPGSTLSKSKGQSSSHRVSTISLLDEEEGENTMSTLDKPIVPRPGPQIKTTPSVPLPTAVRPQKKDEELEDEWNW
ncbi:hypothetical protein FRC02_011572 [Tulasnella sp. 418]|nr:hypothetical protein FRC02_011572 [Tulasnella sp. 418]